MPPNRFALGFDPFAGAEHDDGPVEDTQAPFDFGSEIDVSWSIEEVDRAIFPSERDASGKDGDAALLFFRIVIGFRGP